MDFRTVARTLAPFISDPMTLLDAVDAMLGIPQVIEVRERGGYTHRELVDIAIDDPEVMQHMMDTKKISAIKRLRELTGQGLKETKEAVEDNDVAVAMLRMKLTGRAR